MRLINYIIILSVLLVTACGGGESSSSSSSSVSSSSSSSESSSSSSVAVISPESAPANLTLQLNPVKHFNFSWDAVEGADYYQLFENADGASGFIRVADNIEATSYDHEVALYLRSHASYLVQACNVAGCSDESETVSVSGNLAEAVGYIKAPVTLGATLLMNDQNVSQGFGDIVALSGDGSILAVATRNDLGGVTDTSEDAAVLFEQGGAAVYVFTKTDAGWQQTGSVSELSADVTSLALSDNGDVLAIGLRGESGGSTGINGDEADQSASASGAVYVYRDNDGWENEAYIKASNARASDWFGLSLALSADGATLAVGAPAERGLATGVNGDEALRDSASFFIGAAYVFTDGDNGWEQEAYVKSIEAGGQFFGDAVALTADGSLLAVGARRSTFTAGAPEGIRYNGVHLYRKTDGQWRADTIVNSSEPSLGSNFGTSVALSSDGALLAVGEDTLGAFSDLDLFNKGRVHTYVQVDDQWVFQTMLQPENENKFNQFGRNIAMSSSGDLIAVCAPSDYGDSVALEPDSGAETLSESGAAYVFTEQDGEWLQQSFIKAPNPDSGDYFCGSLGLSANGSTLAVGARGESGSATGVGGDMNNDASGAGAVYLY
ncbi:hypothetical protein [uncultured Gilvimarinus sp.]|uniref:hypothetical protein n=1 Tax=uncultured Gilvimarinus sp. TaxID=1689143 RepID=UPI0030DDB0AB